MEQNKILSDIEELIEQLPYKTAVLTIHMAGKTITIDKNSDEKDKYYGFTHE